MFALAKSGVVLLATAAIALGTVSCSSGGSGGGTASPTSVPSTTSQPYVSDTSASDSKPKTTSQESTAASTRDATNTTGAAPSSAQTANTQQSSGADNASASNAESATGLASSTSTLAVQPLSQYPELPNGCEVTSLATVLNYLGYNVDKTNLSDSFLPKAPVGEADFYAEFVGNPRDDDAFGCYAPVIATTANSYFASVGSALTAREINVPFSDLFGYIDSGTPVIVWATQHMQESYYSVTWNINGKDMTWRTPEHCMVLVGYNMPERTVTVSDPMLGEITSYDMDLFETRYNELYQQAVVIQ